MHPAIAHVRARAAGHPPADGALLAAVRAHARVTVNFHPDRLTTDGRTVAAGLRRTGRYRTQFATGISNGALDDVLGGARSRWEHTLFGGAYDAAHPDERPVYGALDLAGDPDGGAPRFGSCHLRLHPHVLPRCTFALGDSHTEPTVLGTLDTLGGVLAGLPATAVAATPTTTCGRRLDDYVEAHVHGGVDLRHDVAAVVADPSVAAGPDLVELCQEYGIPLLRHPGFVLPAADVPADFRGPDAARLARHLSQRYGTGLLDAALLGRAAAAVTRTPDDWSAWGTPAEVLQLLKYLWHTLVAFGRPAP